MGIWPDTSDILTTYAPPADSCTFGARYSRFVLVAYFSRTVLNQVFDKD